MLALHGLDSPTLTPASELTGLAQVLLGSGAGEEFPFSLVQVQWGQVTVTLDIGVAPSRGTKGHQRDQRQELKGLEPKLVSEAKMGSWIETG